MTVFIVEVVLEVPLGHVSSEGYLTITEAQDFVESRSGNPKKFSDHYYRDEDNTDYCIYEVTIKGA